jgi:hypothetical protein
MRLASLNVRGRTSAGAVVGTLRNPVRAMSAVAPRAGVRRHG